METRFTSTLHRLRTTSMTIIAPLVLSLTCTANSQIGNSIAGENRAIARPGGFQLLVYDAPPPGNIEAINLTVVSVDVVKQDGGIINISNTPTTFNLLQYKEGNPLELANKVIPSGRYSEIRLKLNEDNSIIVSGQTKSLKTPSAQQSGVKLKGHFEIVEGLLYTMRLHFDPNESIVYNPGPDRYILKPVIEITGNSLVDGPFTVTGLIENETVVTELNPDGTLRMIGTFDPRLELRGRYYFNYGNRILTLTLAEVVCNTCAGVPPLTANQIYNLIPAEINISSWTQNTISGYLQVSLLLRSVVFSRIETFAADLGSSYSNLTVNVTYPAEHSRALGILTLRPQSVPGKTFVDVQRIVDSKATFSLRIPHSDLPGNTSNGGKNFDARLLAADNIEQLEIDFSDPASVCGEKISVSKNQYRFFVPIADKALKADVTF